MQQQQQQQQQQPASDGETAMPSTAVTVQPVHNFLEDRHAPHSQAVCDTAHNTAGPSNFDRAKSGKHIPRTDSIADAAAPGSSSGMTHAEEEEETSSCGQHSSSSPPPHRADTEPSTSPDHTVKEEEEVTRSRDLLIHNNAAGVSDPTADDEAEEVGIGKRDRGLPTDNCSGPSNDVPPDVIAKWGHVLDIVTPHSTVTNCFTKTYSRFAKVRGCAIWIQAHLHNVDM